jgi:hypothetical protein
MKVCCGNGKPYETLTTIEKLGCKNDHCTGPTDVDPISPEDYDLLLTGLGTFCTKDCVSSEELCKLLKEKEE